MMMIVVPDVPVRGYSGHPGIVLEGPLVREGTFGGLPGGTRCSDLIEVRQCGRLRFVWGLPVCLYVCVYVLCVCICTHMYVYICGKAIRSASFCMGLTCVCVYVCMCVYVCVQ
jgi:hypothetical protein